MKEHITQLSSDNKTILIFSDPHQDWRRVTHLLKTENYDHAVCLGDWFDSHIQDTPKDAEETAKLLKHLVFKPNFTTLFGNHDTSYCYFGLNKFTWCSGYSTKKHNLIDQVWGNFREAIVDKFQWYIYVDDFLCTHAGLSTHHLKLNHDLSKGYMTEWLNGEINKTNIHLYSGAPYWTFQAGIARGGDWPVGGLNWLDVSERHPIEGLRQIAGHNPGKCIRPHHLEGSLNSNEWNDIFIDCFMKEYLIIKNKKVEVRKYENL